MTFIGLLIFGCVWNGLYRFDNIWLFVVWVLLFCRCLVVCGMGFIGLLIFGCVLHGFYCFVDIWLSVAWVLSVC